MRRVAILLVALLLPWAALAHKASDGYLTVEHRGASLDVRADLALRDLENAIGLDADADGAITWASFGRSMARSPLTRLRACRSRLAGKPAH